VILFLQTWRASIIPLVAVPVSVVGTFAWLYLLGYSINTLTLFGLVLAIGIDPTDALVGSQVVLSFGIPFALVPLLMIAANKNVMGELVNPRWLTALAGALSSLIIALNVFLLYQVFFG